ncbi:hypothetical protein NFI96_019425, partial [Prochilodus magdalenae]
SDAVFTRQNPFPPEPHLARTHYSPSRAKKISKQQKKLALSPVRFGQRTSSSEPPPQPTSLSLADQHFLKGSHRVVICPPPSVKEHQSFSESWPSTDLGSSHASAGNSPCTEPQTSQQEHRVTSGTHEPSVLSRYIERFRYGRPQSREERQRLATEQQLWWTSSSPPQSFSSTPTQKSKERFRGELHINGPFDSRDDYAGSMHSPAEQSQSNVSLSPTRGLLDLSVLALSDSSHIEPREPEILQLQQRASRLLQRSENSLSSGSSGLPISSEGLGCSEISSPVSVDEPVRRPIVPNLMDSNLLTTTSSISGGDPLPVPSALGMRGSHIRPEDDILFQWRLRRKMEQARQWAETSSNSTAFHQSALSRLALQPNPVSADAPRRAGFPFTSAPKETGSVSTPAACPALQPSLPVSSATICKLQPEISSQTYDDSFTSNDSIPNPQPGEEKTIVDSQAPYSLQKAPLKEQGSPLGSRELSSVKHQTASLHSLQSSKATELECHGRSHRRQAKARPGVETGRKANQRKKSDGYVGDANGIERNHRITKGSSRHGGDQDRASCKTKQPSQKTKGYSGGQSITGIVRSGDRVPPPSPIHNTLGQVVSEVLFPAADSPTQPKTPCSSATLRCTPPAAPVSPAPPPQSVSQPSEVISQLIQEAQDSDGLEFEDDSLLLVLRQQRTWVKEQLCEVDRMLDELHED